MSSSVPTTRSDTLSPFNKRVTPITTHPREVKGGNTKRTIDDLAFSLGKIFKKDWRIL